MTDNEFFALVSLLEDNDEVIHKEIEKKLLSMGESVIPRLEVEWGKNKQALVQERITEIIEDIHAQSTLQKIKTWRSSETKDLFEGWFIISQYQYPTLQIDIFRNKINRLVNMIWLEMSYSNTYSDKILALNRILFDIEKYHAHTKTPAEARTFFLKDVFERKEGNPFSLGILYLLICHKLELPISAVVLPHYIALHYEDSRNSFYIDAFNKGSFFNKTTWKNIYENRALSIKMLITSLLRRSK